MKQAAVPAIAIAIIAAASASFSSCSGGSETKTPKPAVEGVTNIRWYDLDSVSNNYELVAELNEEANTLMTNYSNEERQKTNELQRMAQNIQNKAQNGGYLSQQSYEQDMTNLQRKQQQAESYLAKLQQDIAEKAAAQQKQLLDSLNNFLTDYNAKNGIEIIVVKTPGGYYDPSLDITDEVIEGLNARYKGQNGTAAADKPAAAPKPAAAAPATKPAEAK